mmetsp:Transcript_3005/g.1967  ORF Transcript_3005/g.1967 Transcript_3005/m.1967 type:complete len:100 (+) Transcript_3005:696-995(+)
MTDGTMIYPDGDVYVGEFDNNGLKVCGILTYSNGEEFSGDFVDGARDNGTMKFEDGSEYNGPFLDGRMDGSGTIKYANGDYYRGEFNLGVRHGWGTLTL